MNILDVYPVGTLLFGYSADFDPNKVIGGKWSKMAGANFESISDSGEWKGDWGGLYFFLMAAPTDSSSEDKVSGYAFDTSKGRTLTIDKIPKHTHTATATFPQKSTSDADYIQYNSGKTGGYKNTGSLSYETGTVGGAGAGKPIDIEPEYVALLLWQRYA